MATCRPYKCKCFDANIFSGRSISPKKVRTSGQNQFYIYNCRFQELSTFCKTILHCTFTPLLPYITINIIKFTLYTYMKPKISFYSQNIPKREGNFDRNWNFNKTAYVQSKKKEKSKHNMLLCI